MHFTCTFSLRGTCSNLICKLFSYLGGKRVCTVTHDIYGLKGTQNIINLCQVEVEHEEQPVICISMERHYACALPSRATRVPATAIF
jgi:hypothetical protein